MTREHIVRLVAGTLVLTGVSLGYWVHPGYYFICVFVGANLFQSALTKWCLMEDILKKLNLGSTCAHEKTA